MDVSIKCKGPSSLPWYSPVRKQENWMKNLHSQHTSLGAFTLQCSTKRMACERVLGQFNYHLPHTFVDDFKFKIILHLILLLHIVLL